MAITPNHTLDKLRAGKTAIGFGIHHLRGPVAGALAAASGFDCIFVDMEHGAMSVDQASAMCVAAQGQGVTPIVRCCRDALFEGTRCLDNGAMGVVVPHIDTAEDAAEMVRAFRFPPQGMRSWGGPPIQYGYRAPDTATAQAETNANILLCGMIETPEAVANVEAIAATPGLDSLMIGTSDLTATMGIAGQIGHPDVQAAYARVAAACAAHGKVLGMGGVYDEVWAPTYAALGARFILGGSDHVFLMAGASARARFLAGL
jgi:2-keto-3-deoxy-L-rhamnonate aldolase RhmA